MKLQYRKSYEMSTHASHIFSLKTTTDWLYGRQLRNLGNHIYLLTGWEQQAVSYNGNSVTGDILGKGLKHTASRQSKHLLLLCCR